MRREQFVLCYQMNISNMETLGNVVSSMLTIRNIWMLSTRSSLKSFKVYLNVILIYHGFKHNKHLFDISMLRL